MARSFEGLLAKVFDSSNKGLLKDILTGAGLTLASNAVFLTFANQYIDNLQSQTGALSASLASILHIAGIDYSMSIVLSAIVTRLAINPPSLTLTRK